MRSHMLSVVSVTTALFIQQVSAQPIVTKEAALDEIARTTTRLNTDLTFNSATTNRAEVASLVKLTLEQIAALKERLANNQYVRITGFTVGVPYGATVNFEFVK